MRSMKRVRWPSQIVWNCHIGGMENEEQRSDTELLLGARTSL